MRNMSILALFVMGTLLVATTSAFQQTPLVSGAAKSRSFLGTPSTFIYSSLLYLGEETHEDACFHSKDEDSDDVKDGLLFTDYDIQNYCLRVNSDDEVTFNAVLSDDTEIELFDMGDYISNMRVIYDHDLEVLYFSRGIKGEITSHYRAAHTNKVAAIFLTAVFTAEDDYLDCISVNSDISFSSSPYEATWLANNDEEDSFSTDIEIGTSTCFTPEFGRLEDIELCFEFNSDGNIEVSGDDITIFESQENFASLGSFTVSYNDYDDTLYLTSVVDGDTEELFNIIPIQVTYLVEEGDVSTGLDGSVLLTIDNLDENPYDCTSFKNSFMVDSVLFPSIEAICVECTGEDCEITFLLEDDKKQPTYSTFTIDTDADAVEQVFIVSYDLDEDEFTFYLKTYIYSDGEGDTFNFRRYADEILLWAQDADDLEYANIIGDISEDYTATESYTDIAESFNTITSLQFGTRSDSTYGILCEVDNCYLGYYDGDSMTAVKKYAGEFSSIQVFRITEGIDQICVALLNTEMDVELNDCSTEVQWLLYQEYISQYPIFTVNMVQESTSDYAETSDSPGSDDVDTEVDASDASDASSSDSN